MELKDLIEWIKEQQGALDKVVAEAAVDFYKTHRAKSNFVFDVNESSSECYALSRGNDLCYDRPSIGFTYSLWYQGRRVNTFLKYFAEVIFNARSEKSITLFDLGAGTGAVQWACGIILSGFYHFEIKPPKLKVINIDTSPFMLDYNRSYLWPSLVSKYPEISKIETAYSLNSWDNKHEDEIDSNVWITASYLFDHSENSENLKKDFKLLVQQLRPAKILLSSSINKRHLTTQLANELVQVGFTPFEVESDLLFRGQMPNTFTVRKWLNEKASCNFSGIPVWNENALFGLVLNSNNPIFELFADQLNTVVNLYNPPIKVRREIILNDKQKEAAQHDGRPTIIVGPAGCGKSVVITERILNIVNQSIQLGTVNKLAILVTTFNKELKGYLWLWITDLLKLREIEYSIYQNGIKIKGGDFINIVLMHFDVLPYRLWNARSPEDFPFAKDKIQYEHKHLQIAMQAILQIKKEEKITTTEFDNVLEPKYILEEYYRIVYGQDYNKEEIYLSSVRRGRPVLRYEGRRRQLLFRTINRYLSILEGLNYSSFITRRHKFLKKLKKGHLNGMFQHIFVDEFQDCTQSDYNIFYRLIKNPDNLVIAGDYAQAVHLGKVSDIPRFEDEKSERMKNRVTHKLEGSYRLPYRISECIKPISESIKLNGQEDADIITPYKGAPPGARPILVYSKDEGEMAKKVLAIVNAYKLFDVVDIFASPAKNITILEKDSNLQLALSRLSTQIATTDTILRLKGLEKTCVLWSTRSRIENEDEIANYVYTILTRTCGILIISIFDQISPEYKRIISSLRKDRLILWDNDTKQQFSKYYGL